MHYEREFHRVRGGRRPEPGPDHGADRPRSRREPGPRRRSRRSDPEPRDFPPARSGYYGAGELRRYGQAPVPYGPDHTYDFRFGDHFGYGPDFYEGEARIRRAPELRRRRRPRRRE